MTSKISLAERFRSENAGPACRIFVYTTGASSTDARRDLLTSGTKHQTGPQGCIFRSAASHVDRILKMLWGGSGENISIAALSKPMEPRYDETQSQDCERSQPVSRPAGYGRDGDRGDRDESIELACGWHCSWCRAPAAEETGDRRARLAQAVEPLACGGRKERPPDHTHRRGVRGRTRRLLAGALAGCAGHREPRHSCVERRGDARTPPGEERSARHRASEARLSRLAARRARALQDGRGADACRGGRQAAEPGSRDAGWRGEPDYHSGQGGIRPARHSQLQPEAEGGRRAPRAITHARG